MQIQDKFTEGKRVSAKIECLNAWDGDFLFFLLYLKWIQQGLSPQYTTAIKSFVFCSAVKIKEVKDGVASFQYLLATLPLLLATLPRAAVQWQVSVCSWTVYGTEV